MPEESQLPLRQDVRLSAETNATRPLPMFTATLLDHFQNPRNPGELPPPAARAEASNPVCGDILQLSARIENRNNPEGPFPCRCRTPSNACALLLTGTN